MMLRQRAARIAAASVLGLGASAAPAQSLEHLDRFLEWTRAHTPQSGSVVVRFEHAETRAELFAAGLDSTGAWFMASTRHCIGRDTSGVAFRGEARPDSAAPIEEQWGRGMSALGLLGSIPTGVLFFFLERPERIKALHENPDGGWDVGYEVPGPIEQPLSWVRLDASGRPSQSWLDDPADRREQTFEYVAESPHGFDIRRGFSIDGLVSPSEIETPATTAPFSRSAVVGVAWDLNLQDQLRRSARSSGFRQAEDGQWVQDREIPQAEYDTGLAGWRWPLVTAGVLIVGVGAFEIWRRRR